MENTLSGHLPDGPLFNTRANTTLTSQQNIIRRSHQEERRRRSKTFLQHNISSTQHVQHAHNLRCVRRDQASTNQKKYEVLAKELKLAIEMKYPNGEWIWSELDFRIPLIDLPKSGSKSVRPKKDQNRFEQTRTMDGLLVMPYKNSLQNSDHGREQL